MLFLAIPLLAQNTSDWQVDYATKTDHRGFISSNSQALTIAVGDSMTSEYRVNGQLIGIGVDSNWTASGIAFMIYNDLEETWELLYDNDGSTLIEYSVAISKPVLCTPNEMAGIKRVKFVKMTSGSYVTEASAAGNIIIWSIRYN